VNTAPGLVIDTHPGWTEEVTNLVPGAHIAVLADDTTVSIEGRLAGLHLRHTMLVLRAGPTTGFVFLFRKAVTKGTIAEQVITTGAGALNIDACRVATHESYKRAPASSGFSGISGYALGTGRMSNTSNVGRWPPNLLLVHGAGCDDGKCEPGCPPLLDGQSGILSTHGGVITGAMASMGFHGGSVMLEKRVDPTFPGMSSFDKHLGKRGDMVEAVRACATEHAEFRGVLAVLPEPDDTTNGDASESRDGAVYMLKHGKHYKIGSRFECRSGTERSPSSYPRSPTWCTSSRPTTRAASRRTGTRGLPRSGRTGSGSR
jgi:hypothetical protein